ncbi:hypothetical protein [Micromonospora sp. NPDC051141]|uniref:hypothetical protein n=1 Tax=Micromonospora sp. NPDC051141 TaxID=3364284 RepID=UPI0037ABEF20
MRVPSVATRIRLTLAVIAAGLVGGVLVLNSPPPLDDDAVPTPEPTGSWWQDAGHPPRTAFVKVQVGIEKDVSLPVTVNVDYEVILQSDDPLLAKVTAGEVSGSELVGRLTGGSLDDDRTPTVQRGGTGAAHVLVSGKIFPSAWTTSDGRLRVPISIEATSEDDSHAPTSTSVVTRRSLTVQATDMKIIAVSGGGIVEQTPTMVRFEGRPGAAKVTFELEDPDVDDASRSYPFQDLELSDFGEFIISGLILLAPWLALLIALRSSRRKGGIETAIWLCALTITVGGTIILTVDEIFEDLFFPLLLPGLSGIAVMSTAVLVACTGRALRGLSAWDRLLYRRLLLGCAALTATAGCVAWGWGGVRVKPSPAEWLGYLILVAAAAALAMVYNWRFALRGAVLGLSAALLLAISPILTSDFLAIGSAWFLAMALMLGVVYVYIAETAALAPRLLHYRKSERRILYATGALVFLPVLHMVANPYAKRPVLYDKFSGLTVAMAVLGMVLFAVTVVLARRRGQRPEATGDIVVWALAQASTIVVAIDRGHLIQFDALAAGSFLLLWWLLLPRHHQSRGVTLAGVSPVTHTALVKAEMRRRLMELSAHDVYRSARALLRDGSISTREYYRRQQAIDDAAATRGRVIAGVPVSDALATSGGCSPWNGALAAMLYATPLFLLILGYELGLPAVPYTLIFSTPWQAALALAHILRWIVYAAIFGYFYPLIRGRTPVTKAMGLVLLILPAELLSVLSLIEPGEDRASGNSITTSGELLLALGIRTGQVLVFCTVLGLAWERRMAMLAGYRWDRLRNIRSLRALATPAGTVIVAIATALGTALAGTAVAALLTTGPNAPPAPQSTPSPSQSPEK